MVAREGTIKSNNGIRVRVELVVRTLAGKLKFIESKFGPNSEFTTNQKSAYPQISNTGGTVCGNNGSSAGLSAG